MKEKETSKLYNCITSVDSQFIEEAQAKPKKKTPVWTKWGTLVACLAVIIAAGIILPRLTLPTTSQPGNGENVSAPMIIISGKNYVAPNMPIDELPAEYRYLRDLTAEEANNTGLEGCAIYVNPQDDEMNTIYLYQECGTPIGENKVDNTQRQWAYVQWSIYK